jgi:hypothetical protein
MMPGRLCVLALTLLASLDPGLGLGLGLGRQAQARLLAPAEQNRLAAQLDKRPMVFFVAKGQADSCGPGCSEWIAAEGQFLPGTAQRFRDFLGKLSRRDLPIFFHSPGGGAGDALQIGTILRERRMTAGIGRTIAEQCGVFARNDPCQRAIASGSEIRARLRTAEGQCHSACVIAFAGASNRRIPAGALLGVHSIRFSARLKQLASKQPAARQMPNAGEFSVSAAHHGLERYLILMGIDPRLQQIAAKVEPRRMYVLGRDEITRFGVESSAFYETSWAAFADGEKRPFALKSVTRTVEPDRKEHRVAGVHFWCFRERIWLIYQREASSETRSIAFVRIAAGESELSLQYGKEAAASEMWMAPADLTFLNRTMAVPSLTVTEGMVASETTRLRERAFKVSTAGLSRAMGRVLKSCEGAKLPEAIKGGGKG